MENILRAPWTAEVNLLRYRGLFNVYDCDGNAVVRNKIEEVARLIADAPVTKALLDAQLKPAISVYADPKQYDLDSWLPSSDPYFLEDDGAIEDELLRAEEEDDDDPDETLLDCDGRSKAGDIDGREMESADVVDDYLWLQT